MRGLAFEDLGASLSATVASAVPEPEALRLCDVALCWCGEVMLLCRRVGVPLGPGPGRHPAYERGEHGRSCEGEGGTGLSNLSLPVQ